MRLISVHLPKTAGTTFQAQLGALGFASCSLDYGDAPLHCSRFARRQRALTAGAIGALTLKKQPEIIHGHFLPVKYRYLSKRETRYVTWLREPVSRLKSHFDYWQREYNPGVAGKTHRKMIEDAWTFERFALGPELRNIYSEFLWGFPLSRFDFVGLTEFYDEDLLRFVAQFGLTLPDKVESANRRPDQPTGVSLDLRQEITQWHAKDIALYQQALEWREAGRWRP